jgi:hypothetical protein
MDGFTALAFGFCAAVTMYHGTELVDFGEVVAGQCETFALIGDSRGRTARIKGHDIGVDFFDSGAEVAVDGLKFIIPRTLRI